MDKRADYCTRYGPPPQHRIRVRVFAGPRETWVLAIPIGDGEPLEWCRQLAAAILAEQPWLRAEGEHRRPLVWLILSHADLGAARLDPDGPSFEVRFRSLRVEPQAPWEQAWRRQVGPIRDQRAFVDWRALEAAIGEPLAPGPRYR